MGVARGAAGVGLVLVSIAGCQSESVTPAGENEDKKKAAAATLAIAPAEGGKARTDRGVTVRAAGGKVQRVQVRTGKYRLAGKTDRAGTTWRSKWALHPGRRYTVTAVAVNADGRRTTKTARFTTAKPKRTITAKVTPGDGLLMPGAGKSYGVGMPIMVDFSTAVPNRKAVEKSFEVRAEKPVEGAWHWLNRRQAIFRTKKYWPRDQKVEFTAHLAGVRAGKGLYGTRNVTSGFTIGDRQVLTVNTKTHQSVFKRNGKKKRKMAISAGRGTDRSTTTTNGIHLAMSREYHVVMDSTTIGIPKGRPGYYRLDVNYAVRISDSGEYTHSAPWSVGSQGAANVSHGCVNLSPSNAKWWYDRAQLGDIVKITGTKRDLEVDNGWGFWQSDWDDWVKGGALDEPVTPAKLN